MSQILNRLKEAEEERQRVMAERGEQRAARPADPRPPEQPAAQPTPQQRSRLAAAVAMAAALAVVFWVGTLMPRKPAVMTSPPAVVAPPPAAALPARAPPELFKLERDLDAFASRVKE